jgi:hypothetical protein
VQGQRRGCKRACAFCGNPVGHDGLRCPRYRLRLDSRTVGEQGEGSDRSPARWHRRPGRCSGRADRSGWGLVVGSEVLSVGWPSAPGGSAAGSVGGVGALQRPSRAWGARVAGPAFYWTIAARFLVLPGAALVWLRRVWMSDAVRGEDSFQAEGLADRGQIRRAAGTGALLARARTLRPAVEKPGPADAGLRLGRSRGVDCWRRWRIPFCCWVRPGSGKARAW